MSKIKRHITEAELWKVFSRADELITFATDKKTGKINPVVDKDSLRELSEALEGVTGQSTKGRWEAKDYHGTIENVPMRYVPKQSIIKDNRGLFQHRINWKIFHKITDSEEAEELKYLKHRLEKFPADEIIEVIKRVKGAVRGENPIKGSRTLH